MEKSSWEARWGMKHGDATWLKFGDILFLDQVDDRLGGRKAMNPFDVLARQAVEEYKAGRTRSIHDVAADLGVDLDAQK